MNQVVLIVLGTPYLLTQSASMMVEEKYNYLIQNSFLDLDNANESLEERNTILRDIVSLQANSLSSVYGDDEILKKMPSGRMLYNSLFANINYVLNMHGSLEANRLYAVLGNTLGKIISYMDVQNYLEKKIIKDTPIFK